MTDDGGSGRGSTIDALINLLEDEDSHVSTMAMEQLLLDRDVDALIADLQESHSPVLRNRIHQLGNILKLRRGRALFIDSVMRADLPIWDGVIQINYQYNPQINVRTVNQAVADLISRLPRRLTTVRVASFMRDENFSPAGEDILGADLYLIEDVLAQRVGSPILLSLIARHLGAGRGWQPSVVLYKGKHCLVDMASNLLEPGEGWRVTRLSREDRLHPCGDRDIWLTILCQLFLSALIDGRLQTIHRVGSILAKLCEGEFRDLPFPLGS